MPIPISKDLRLVLLIPFAALGLSVIYHFAASTTPYALQTEEINYSQIAPPGKAALLQFDDIEETISRLEYEPNSMLALDSSLESALRKAAEFLANTNPDKEVIERIQFLIKKDLPEPAASQFVTLFPIFLTYLIAENELLLKDAGGSATQELLKNKQLHKLQQEYLGPELTNAFYGGQHIFANYLLERRRIQEDETLSDAERESETNRVQAIFNEQMAEQNDE